MRIIARQSTVSALGAGNWDELTQTIEEESSVGLILYTQSLPGAPENAIEQLVPRAGRLVLAVNDGEVVDVSEDRVTKTPRPVTEESLVIMARAMGAPSTQLRMSFMPVDFIQMICMSGDSQVIVLGRDNVDTGIVEVRSGEVWTAFDGLGVGEEAFERLIRPEMRARIASAKTTGRERTIFKGLHELVLDSLRRIDEGQVPIAPTLTPAQFEVALSSPEQLAERIRDLSADAQRLLMQRNYDDAARALIHLSELDPGSPLVRANLQQLRRLGYPK